jgi:hypothetical protein
MSTSQSPEDAASGEDDEVTCVCGEGWGGKFMIACDACGRWLHGVCFYFLEGLLFVQSARTKFSVS